MIKLQDLLPLNKRFFSVSVAIISSFLISASTGQIWLANCTEGLIYLENFALSTSETGLCFGSTTSSRQNYDTANKRRFNLRVALNYILRRFGQERLTSRRRNRIIQPPLEQPKTAFVGCIESQLPIRYSLIVMT